MRSRRERKGSRNGPSAVSSDPASPTPLSSLASAAATPEGTGVATGAAGARPILRAVTTRGVKPATKIKGGPGTFTSEEGDKESASSTPKATLATRMIVRTATQLGQATSHITKVKITQITRPPNNEQSSPEGISLSQLLVSG
eukprot:CAMPEP_0168625462 /NCGR_PEP_ID=MMETSP0449_2-20121227/10021_1 /TAXON_ID=1082188 /ORGANISM="Strombidium rassoulzadegani, Strain ras09" /LENGTH=142 /DNA_ID=CAMNT_0008667211 /DNA_START=164 /DNA_END=588 /DNA_ORIENTATION=-